MSSATGPAVRHDRSCRDRIELHRHSAADLRRLGSLLTITMTANA